MENNTYKQGLATNCLTCGQNPQQVVHFGKSICFECKGLYSTEQQVTDAHYLRLKQIIVNS